MFVKMRRKDRELPKEEVEQILTNGEYGILTTTGCNGYPHPIPMNYVYKDGSIWLHCAKEGSKLDDIHADARVAFCVIGSTELLPEKFATNYSSVIAYGEISEVQGEALEFGLYSLIEKYSPGFLVEGKAYIERAKSKVCVLRIDIHSKTGKSRR